MFYNVTATATCVIRVIFAIHATRLLVNRIDLIFSATTVQTNALITQPINEVDNKA